MSVLASQARNTHFARETYTALVRKTVFFLSSLLLAGAAYAPSLAVLSGPSNRVVTPNGDGRNDTAHFTFTNPRDAAGTLRIFDRLGRELHSASINPGGTTASWDGRASGVTVATGVYIYVLTVDQTTRSGSLLVVR